MQNITLVYNISSSQSQNDFSFVYTNQLKISKIFFIDVTIGSTIQNKVYPQFINATLSEITIKNLSLLMNVDKNYSFIVERSYFIFERVNLKFLETTIQ